MNGRGDERAGDRAADFAGRGTDLRHDTRRVADGSGSAGFVTRRVPPIGGTRTLVSSRSHLGADLPRSARRSETGWHRTCAASLI